MKPESEIELSQAVRDAHDARTPLRIHGGGTRSGLGHAVMGEVLDTGGLTGVTIYEPGALTLVARAGTPLADIDAMLAAEGQQLAFEPMDHRPIFGTNGAPTIGGVVAANVSGPRRIQAGACRDSLIGVRFVDGRGTILKNGGRVMKNVTGYDLVKLLCGSHGTLGVLTEVAFKVLPKPETSALISLPDLSPDRAVAAMSAALASPYDVTGAAYVTDTRGTPAALIRVEGFEGSVRYRADRLREALAEFADPQVDMESESRLTTWTDIRDAVGIARGEGDVWRISVKPSDGPMVVAALPEGGVAQMDWGGGLIWVRVPEGTDLRAALKGIPGHATLVRAAEDTKTALGVFHPEPEPLARIGAGLRAQFDPAGVLNPGRMGPQA